MSKSKGVVCVVPDCEEDGTVSLTQHGRRRHCYVSYACLPPGRLAWLTSADPKDLQPYSEWVRELSNEQRKDTEESGR